MPLEEDRFEGAVLPEPARLDAMPCPGVRGVRGEQRPGKALQAEGKGEGLWLAPLPLLEVEARE